MVITTSLFIIILAVIKLPYKASEYNVSQLFIKILVYY